MKNDNTLFKYTSDFLQKLRWSNRAEAQAALSMVTAYSKDFGNSAEERKLYREAATIIRRWIKDFATDQRGRARNPNPTKHANHDWYVEGMVRAQRQADYGKLNSLKADLRKMSKANRDAIMQDFRDGYKAWYDAQKAGGVVVSGGVHARKNNPEIETRELSLYADNLGPSSQKEYEKRVYEIRQDFLRNVRLNNKRVWTKKRLMNLTKHAAHMAARAYSEDFGSGAFRYKEIFSDADINNTAKYLYESWLSEGSYAGNPKKIGEANAFDGKGPHVVFIYNEKKMRWVGKIGNRYTAEVGKTKAHKFKTITEAQGIARGIALPEWATNVGVMKASNPVKFAKGIQRLSFSDPFSGKARRSNPVGPTQKEVDRAGDLFREFTGDFPEGMKSVKLAVPKTGLVIGELDGVLYTTVRDGKTEKYQHDFKKTSRPHLISSHDGSSLHIVGGEYEFTERGIEDK